MAFRDRVREEANHQRALRAAGEAIPPSARRYARIAGAATFGLGGGGAALIVALGVIYGQLYYGAALFLAALGVLGLVQLASGRHIMTGRD
ncbi:MAG TPA: hypothetical protein PKW35_23920 [Nannocystaceae bacterium]|nr:hypothetical protein [Nannocystaceae bacterium]